MSTLSVKVDGAVRSPLAEDGFITQYDPRVRTLYDLFQVCFEDHPDRNFLGRRADDGLGSYEWETYERVWERVKNLASGLSKLGITSKNVGIYSKNRPEWLLVEHACYARNWVTVPLYDTLGRDGLQFIIEQTEMHICFTTSDKANALDGLVKEVILMDDGDTSFNGKVHKLKELESVGSVDPVADTPPAPEDLFTICYTSGATGTPKGVMLTHSTLVTNIAAQMAVGGNNRLHPIPPSGPKQYFARITEEDVHLSYLPLAHIMERLVVTTMTALGASIGFYSGEIGRLMEDAKALKPTCFTCVPRVCNRIYDKVMLQVQNSNFVKRALFQMAYATKKSNLGEKNQLGHWFWDWLVFSKIRNNLGGRVRKVLCGSAPLRPEVLQFMRVALACEVYEGYGQTESCAGSLATLYQDWSSTGNVGIPLPCVELKLVDVPEAAAHPDDQNEHGEILIRGPACFSGYYKDEVKTKEAVDSEGWIHTGDVGSLDPQGRLSIIDRRKSFFKLAQGEYITPEKIEVTLGSCPSISQLFVHGEPTEACTVAIIVPNMESFKDIEQLLDEIRACKSSLSGLELPKAIYLETEAFSIENGLLTATLKSKRNTFKERYREQFLQLYASVRSGQSNSANIVLV